MTEQNDFPGESLACLKGRGCAIVYGDDVWDMANPPYFVDSPEAFNWSVMLDEPAAEHTSKIQITTKHGTRNFTCDTCLALITTTGP